MTTDAYADHQQTLRTSAIRLAGAIIAANFPAPSPQPPRSELLQRRLSSGTPTALTHLQISQRHPQLREWLESDASLWRWLDENLDDDAFLASNDSFSGRRQVALMGVRAIERNDGFSATAADLDVIKSVLDGNLSIDEAQHYFS